MNDEDQIAELTEVLDRMKDRRMYERYQAVLLHLEGYPMTEEVINNFFQRPKNQKCGRIIHFLCQRQATGIIDRLNVRL